MWPSVHRILEVQLQLAHLALDPTRHMAGSSERARKSIAEAMAHADVVLWESEIEELAVTGSEALCGLKPVRRVPVTQWWCRDERASFPRCTGLDGRRWAALWQLWMPAFCEVDGGLDQVCVGFFVPESLEDDPKPGCVWDQLQIGECGVLCPQKTISDTGIVDWLFAEYEFLHGTAIGTQVLGPNRSHRRSWAAQNGVALTQQIRRLVLRRYSANDNMDSSSMKVDWSCRWMVRGHWRAQFYPSSNCHRPLWITPHVKGPATKPLKTEAVRTIYHAAR